jgi:cytochrome P450
MATETATPIPPTAPATVLPPGPPLPALVQSLLWIVRPVELMELSRRRYGPAFTMRLGPSVDVVFLADPAAVKAVFTAPPDLVPMGDINGLFRPILGSHSLLLLDGAAHMRERKLLLPLFHGRRVQRYVELMEEIAAEEVASWPVGEPFELQPRMQSITLRIVIRAVFGVEKGAQLEHLVGLLKRLLDLCRSTSTMLPALRHELGGRSPWGRLMSCVREVDRVLYAEIVRRRADPLLDLHDDVLSMLIMSRDEAGEGLSDVELRDQLLTLLVAGHETTAGALAWTLERLVRHPAALARLTEGVGRGEDAYLDAVIKESLRLRPVLPIVARKLTGPLEVGGRTYPKRTVLMPCLYLVHRDPELYPDPSAFRPERYLEGQPEPYSWIPFGGGTRRCLGAAFATVEMRAVLRAVVERAVLRPAGRGSESVKRRSFTFAPRRGARVVMRELKDLPLPPPILEEPHEAPPLPEGTPMSFRLSARAEGDA